MSQASQPTERIWHVTAESTRGYEHDDEDAFTYLREHNDDIQNVHALALFNRSFGGRGIGGVSTTIVFAAPVASDPAQQVTPQSFFVNTELVEFTITEVRPLGSPEALPEGVVEQAPKGRKFDVKG